MKYFALLFLPILAFGQPENPDQNIFGTKHLPDAKILVKDSSFVYFRKTARADTIFKTPISNVNAKLKGVPTADYDNLNDAMSLANKESSRGNVLQLVGLGISLVGYGILVVAVSDENSPQSMYKAGGYTAVAGGALTILGLSIELRSHRHLERYNMISGAELYR